MSKVEAIEAINSTTKVCNILRFVGLVNYYRYMWGKSAHTLAPLTKLCSTKVKLKWTDEENDAFTSTKIVGCDVLLYYPNFNEIFIINIDASKTQIGGVISQNGKPTAFYS